MSNDDIRAWIDLQQSNAFTALGRPYGDDDAARRTAQRTNVAWMDARRQLTEASDDAVPAEVFHAWRIWIEAREADPMDAPNEELRRIQRGVADAILAHIQETDA